MYSEGGNIPCIPIEASSLSELLLNFSDIYIFQAVTELSISGLRNNTSERECVYVCVFSPIPPLIYFPPFFLDEITSRFLILCWYMIF